MDDAQRFTNLFHAHFDAVVAYVRRRVRDDRVDDVVEETFLAAWRHLERVPEDALPWLYRAAWLVLSHEYRRQAGAARFTRPMGDPDSVQDIADDVTTGDLWTSAFSRLSEDDQEVLRLTGWEGLPSVDAARVLGCSLTAFKVRLHRARTRLVSFIDLECRPAAGPIPVPLQPAGDASVGAPLARTTLANLEPPSPSLSHLSPNVTKEVCP